MKRCVSFCKQELPLEMFGKNRSKPDGLQSSCKSCKKQEDQNYQERHASKIKEVKHKYYLENKESITQRTLLYAKQNREKHNGWRRKAGLKLKLQTFMQYGSVECAFCSFSDHRALSIDHVNDNGADHRRAIGLEGKGGYVFYQWLKQNGYPEGFQTLCANCQFKKRAAKWREGTTTIQQTRAAYARSVKVQCLEQYGGLKCECGEDDCDVLTLDHVNDDGAEHRRDTNTKGYGFYIYLRKNRFPQEPQLRVMCMNCQTKKRADFYKGVQTCPSG